MLKAEIFKGSLITAGRRTSDRLSFCIYGNSCCPAPQTGYIISFTMADINSKPTLKRIAESGKHVRVRMLAYFSAAIASGVPEKIRPILIFFKNTDFDHIAVYETILQSYLFLGFPRMIEAAIYHREIYDSIPHSHQADFDRISTTESADWFDNGVSLCRTVYGKNYGKLEDKFFEISPEIFRWMVIEGYGKVLSRPGMKSIERELAEVAALIVDRREHQLVSHILGSLNVGAGMDLIECVNDDIREIAGEESYRLAVRVLKNIRESK